MSIRRLARGYGLRRKEFGVPSCFFAPENRMGACSSGPMEKDVLKNNGPRFVPRNFSIII
jgi:hypothetical protein